MRDEFAFELEEHLSRVLNLLTKTSPTRPYQSEAGQRPRGGKGHDSTAVT